MKNSTYKIQDWFEHPDFGVIVSITSPELDKLSKDEIKDLVGDYIAILDAETQQEKKIQVSQVEVSTSIIDKKNVNICLGNSIKLSEIKPNSNIIFVSQRAKVEVNKL